MVREITVANASIPKSPMIGPNTSILQKSAHRPLASEDIPDAFMPGRLTQVLRIGVSISSSGQRHLTRLRA